MPDWDDLRLFLAVARAGSFVVGGRNLGLNHTTLARRITALEGELGARLIDRSPRGVVLTQGGQALLHHAERMEEAALAAAAIVQGQDESVSGSVRVATPEAFGTFFLAQRVRLLRERYPGIEVELVPESRAISLSKREADIAVSLSRPEQGRLRAARLVDYRLGIYATRSLIDSLPPIAAVDDLRGLAFVSYIEEMIGLAELRMLDKVPFDRSVFRSSSVAAQMEAVFSGLGFGLLHCFTVDPAMDLVRVLPQDVEIVRSYWMVMHADLARVPRIRVVADFLVDQVRHSEIVF